MQSLPNTTRVSSIDVLRGLIIVFMSLDHVRDFFASTPFNPMDVTRTTPAWFFTRWITHYCAPTFVFLAGVSAFIYGTKVNKGQLAKFLWTRGLWLIFIEFTFVHFGWQFDFTFFFVQVIWVIGWSMIILGLLIYLPTWAIALFTIVLITGHNALDGVSSGSLWWSFLHVQNFQLGIIYPLIPWPAVMSLGYLVGQFYTLDEKSRKKNLLLSGVAAIAVFVVVRFINIYGDLQPWAYQPRGWLYTFFDFLDTTKYPPSLQFLCMTLGPSMIALALFENLKGPVMSFFQTFGRVPFFYYIFHIYIIHTLAIVYHGVMYNEWRTWLFGGAPATYVPSLLTAYIAWIVVNIILYFLCRWFSEVKRKYSYWWLKYL